MTRRTFRPPFRRAARALLMAAPLAFLSVPLAAQQQAPPPQLQAEDVQKVQDWTVRCQQNPQDAARRACFIYQQAVDSQTNNPVMRMEVGFSGAEQKPTAIVTVPLGVLIAPGLMIKVGDAEPVAFSYHHCARDGCKIRFAFDDKLLGAFRAGLGGTVIVQVVNGQKVEIPFSLKGFTGALEASAKA